MGHIVSVSSDVFILHLQGEPQQVKLTSASATLLHVNISLPLLSDPRFGPHAGVQGCCGNQLSFYSETTAKLKNLAMTANEKAFDAKNNQTEW